MPELPEAEVIARQLRSCLIGAMLKECWVGRPDIVRRGLNTLDWYRGSRVTQIDRYGKAVILAFSREPGTGETRYLAVELGMTGLILFQAPNESYQKHTHLILSLAGCREPEVLYWNPRRFGRVSFLDDQELKAFLRQRFGWDPLRDGRGEFIRLVKGRRGRIKPLLLHQQIVAGIGNIYANEILFRAGIHPHARGQRLSVAAIARLYRNLQAVLTEAVACGGSTIRDFLAPDGTAGRFQERHLVYNRAGHPCPSCRRPIRRLIAERSSFYCPACQRR